MSKQNFLAASKQNFFRGTFLYDSYKIASKVNFSTFFFNSKEGSQSNLFLYMFFFILCSFILITHEFKGPFLTYCLYKVRKAHPETFKTFHLFYISPRNQLWLYLLQLRFFMLSSLLFIVYLCIYSHDTHSKISQMFLCSFQNEVNKQVVYLFEILRMGPRFEFFMAKKSIIRSYQKHVFVRNVGFMLVSVEMLLFKNSYHNTVLAKCSKS